MDKPAATPEPDIYDRIGRAWVRFWFTPADPTVLGLIRICCGLVTLYTTFVYTFTLDEFMGKHAWYDLKARQEIMTERPIVAAPLRWDEYKELPPIAEPDKTYQDYVKKYQTDPRLAYSKGTPVWSLWFHVTDPAWMMFLHGCILLVTLLFTLGLATRLTAPLTWFGTLCYIHRNTMVLFGVDTMMTVLLTYLMIGPSGAALSLDRLIARWWHGAKPGIVSRWRTWWGRPCAPADVAPAAYTPAPAPSISANVAYRLLQINVCFVYIVSGLTKLQGNAWWTGTATWGVLANFEFAPMHLDIYNHVLRRIGSNQLLFYFSLTLSCLFTLGFEIGYAFLIWLRSTRWVFLWGAITLHGLIGLFMGLKTFSLMMLVMNMAFLTSDEVRRFLAWINRALGRKGSHEPGPHSRGLAKNEAILKA